MFRICPIQQVTGTGPYHDRISPFPFADFEQSRCVWLPQYSEAKILLEKFIQDIEYIHHVVHCPSLLSVLNDVYVSLSQQGQVKPGPIILLLSIFASCTHSWVRGDSGRGLFSTPGEANSQSQLWLTVAHDILDIATRTALVSIEGIQGIMISSFVLANMEGISRRCRSLFSTALVLARELGLHCIDRPSNACLANSAQAEIGRRIWWYLAASDWSVFRALS